MELAEIYNQIMEIQNQLTYIYTGQKVLFFMITCLLTLNALNAFFRRD